MIEVKKLTPDRVDDFFMFFDRIAFSEHPEWGCDCYCCFYHAPSAAEWEGRTGEQNARVAREMILKGELRGCLAYADGKPVGWCHYDAKAKLPGLKVFYPLAAGEEEGVGSIVCFTVAQGWRGQGIAKKLFNFACDDLSASGFVLAEAYPNREAASDEAHYHGPLSMYLANGFSIYKKIEELTVVRKSLK